MADRDAHLTDPASYAAPLERLLSTAYAAELAARIDPARAARPPAARVPRGGGTIWLGVVDGEGDAVSLIESNYMGFGSGVVDPATGIAFQNRGSFFSLEPDHPNVLGPAKRTLHTLMPGMLFRDGRPWVVIGSMGGDAQPQIHAAGRLGPGRRRCGRGHGGGDAALVRGAGGPLRATRCRADRAPLPRRSDRGAGRRSATR